MATSTRNRSLGKACAMTFGAVVALFVLGCRMQREVTERDRKEAAVLASEAQFAMTVRDWARAEGLYVKAIAVAPTGDYWVRLGAVRKRLDNRAGARAAYESALKAFEFEAVRYKNSPEPWLRQAFVLGLLGRKSDIQPLLAKAAKYLPSDPRIRAMQDPKEFERMLASPEFKEMAL